MAPFRFSEWIRRGEPIVLYGDGTQTRDFTFIDDIALGTLSALRPLGYEIINLGGGKTPVSVNEMIGSLEDCIGKKAVVERHDFQSVDMRDTSADVTKASSILRWSPLTSPDKGFKLTAEWHKRESAWLENIVM